MANRRDAPVEWPTLGLLLVTYAAWAVGTTWAFGVHPLLGVVLTGLAIAQFSSLQHEVLHGHPFASRRLNEALVFPALALFIPYGRFRDTHLAHHRDEHLTDPYDDPESNYLDPEVWTRLSQPMRLMLRVNNTLLGRMIIGPFVSTWAFVRGDWRAITAGDRQVRDAWMWHLPGVALVALWLWASGGMGFWPYLASVWIGFGLLKIRTFLEHRAHEKVRGRTVIIEDRGPLSLLFLNNNFHAVHHAKPGVAWYRLPEIYAAQKDEWQRRNDNYVFRSYRDVFGRFLIRAKDPVAHPLWPHAMDRPARPEGTPAIGPALEAAFAAEQPADAQPARI